MWKSVKVSVRLLLAIAMCIGASACGSFGPGNSTNPGSTPNIQFQTSLRVVGTIGTPFSAVVSDSTASWTIQGVVPLSIVIVRTPQVAMTPTRIVATKTVNNNALISVELINGFAVKDLSSSTAPFGVVVGAINGNLPTFAPPANPDVRFFVKAPASGVFNALIENQSAGNVLQARAPALILFENPFANGSKRIDGIFSQVQGFGGFQIDLLFNGAVVQTALGGVNATLKYP